MMIPVGGRLAGDGAALPFDGFPRSDVSSPKRAPDSSAVAVSDGLNAGSAFLGSILAGTLLGFLGDLWLNTDPWLVVIGVVVGSINGFVQMRPAMIKPTGKQAYRGR